MLGMLCFLQYSDRAGPWDKHNAISVKLRGKDKSPFAAQLFGNGGRDHMDKYGLYKLF